jgi:hypothetical protein
MVGSDWEFCRPFAVEIDGQSLGTFQGNNTANQLYFVPIFSATNLSASSTHLITIQIAGGQILQENPAGFILDSFM